MPTLIAGILIASIEPFDNAAFGAQSQGLTASLGGPSERRRQSISPANSTAGLRTLSLWRYR